MKDKNNRYDKIWQQDTKIPMHIFEIPKWSLRIVRSPYIPLMFQTAVNISSIWLDRSKINFDGKLSLWIRGVGHESVISFWAYTGPNVTVGSWTEHSKELLPFFDVASSYSEIRKHTYFSGVWVSWDTQVSSFCDGARFFVWWDNVR